MTEAAYIGASSFTRIGIIKLISLAGELASSRVNLLYSAKYKQGLVFIEGLFAGYETPSRYS